jgi:nucleoside-diphosphate-sugar epimerase
MKKVLITGGAGFVGRRFVRRFLDVGDEVHCVDPVVPLTGGIHPQHGWPLFNPFDYHNFIFYDQDCREYFKRADAVDFDLCLHLAAIVGGRLMIENDPLAVAEDLSIDAAYWQWAKETRPAKTICFSSSAAYPVKYQQIGDYRLLNEEMIDFEGDIGVPDMTYGWSKLTCEYLALLAYQKHGLKSVCYRPFSGYGEDQDDTYPFPGICKRAIAQRGESLFYVWGSGDQMRDFIHIEDCVQGVLRTMDQVENGEAINLSTGIYTSFKQFAAIATALCGYSPEVRGMSDKPSGVHARAGDTAKQRRLGFEYQIDLHSGIEQAIRYYLKQFAA